MNSPDNRAASSVFRKGMNYWFGQKRDGFYAFAAIVSAVIYAAGLVVAEYEIGADWARLSSWLKAAGFLAFLMIIPLILIHRNLQGLHQFLGLFRQADHLPRKQIAHVNSFCMTIFLSLTLVTTAIVSPLLDPVWAAIAKFFRKEWKPGPVEPPAMEQVSQGQMPHPDMTEIFGKPSPPPAWLKAAEKIFFVVGWLLVAAMIFLILRSMVRSVWSWITKPRLFDDDEKIYLKPVFSLSAEGQPKTDAPKEPRGFRRYLSYNSRIRRLYRREILSRHTRNSHPQQWASPRELESGVGLDNQTLHELYEKARYADTPCTEDDWKKLNQTKETR